VKPEELPGLRYKVDLLSTPERIADRSALDAARFGVIVESGEKRGLLLPDLAGIETVAEQIRVACEKAEIGKGEPLTLWRFEVTRFQEAES
jgi:AMMECR1 domain-containing protein